MNFECKLYATANFCGLQWNDWTLVGWFAHNQKNDGMQTNKIQKLLINLHDFPPRNNVLSILHPWFTLQNQQKIYLSLSLKECNSCQARPQPSIVPPATFLGVKDPKISRERSMSISWCFYLALSRKWRPFKSEPAGSNHWTMLNSPPPPTPNIVGRGGEPSSLRGRDAHICPIMFSLRIYLPNCIIMCIYLGREKMPLEIRTYMHF